MEILCVPDIVDGGKVGLAITQAIALTGVVQFGIRRSADVENILMSVERVVEYGNLPREKQPDIPKSVPSDWPQQGKIVFQDVGLKYDEDGGFVLKSLNFVVNPKEKVLSRTGAFKFNPDTFGLLGGDRW